VRKEFRTGVFAMKPSIHLNEGIAAEDIYDCWNDIGVWRKGSIKCERLNKVIHCNNCKVFANSGRSLLHRAIPASYTDEWTEIISKKTHSGKNELRSAIHFRVEEEWYLAPTSMIHDITIVKKILAIPHNTNPKVQGITNIRGEIMTCLSLAHLLHIDSTKSNSKDHHTVSKRMLIIDSNSFKVAFPVDEVKGISKFGANDIRIQHDTSRSTHNMLAGIVSIGNHHAGLIDADVFKNEINIAIK